MGYPRTAYQRMEDNQRYIRVKDELEQVKPLYERNLSIDSMVKITSLDERTIEKRLKTLERLKMNDPKKYKRIKEKEEIIEWFRG